MKYALLPLALFLSACGSSQVATEQGADEYGFTAPTEHTIKANRAVAERLPIGDQADFEDAKRGLIAAPDSLIVKRSDSDETVWNHDAFKFIEGVAAPDSVNPSLWRQAQLNHQAGLFKVTDGIYQIRAFDLANLSIIEGD